jgi:hypothetical protein
MEKGDTMKCFFCKTDIDEKDTSSFVMLKLNNDMRVPAHLRHKGISEEYDRQLGIKKEK